MQNENHKPSYQERFKSLLNAIKTISSCNDYQMFHKVLLGEVADISRARGGSLFLFKGGELVLKHSLDPGHVPDSISLPLKSDSVLDQVVKNKEDLVVGDIQNHSPVTTSGWGGYSDGSFMVLPLLDLSGNILGMVNLHNKIDPPFIEQDSELSRQFLTFCTNMSALFHKNHVLTQKQQYYAEIISHLPHGFLLFDRSGRIFDASAKFSNLIGLQSASCLQKNYWQLTPERWHEREKVLLDDVVHNNATRFLEKELLDTQGLPLRVKLSYSLLREALLGRILATVERR